MEDVRYESEFAYSSLRPSHASRFSLGGAPILSWLFLLASLASITGTGYIIAMWVLTAGRFVLGE